jgi:hypothetical protein
MTAVIVSLAAVISIIGGGIIFQFFRYRQRYGRLAESLCDQGSWHIRFYLRILTLKGRVQGHPIRYSVFGDDRGGLPVSTYLLLEYPVKTNLRVYAGGELSGLPPELENPLRTIQETPNFRGLVISPQEAPFLGTFLSRPVGLGYRPGILLWRWGTAVFDPDAVRKDFDLLLTAAKQGL